MTKKMSRIMWVGGALLVVIIAIFWTVHLKNSQQITNTKVVVITPFQDGKLLAKYKGVKTVAGNCFAGSAATGQQNAWRCMVGNQIFDPCFAANVTTKDNAKEQKLICFKTPWQKPITELTAKLHVRNANRNVDVKKTLPWAIELGDGSKCTAFTGATAPVDGKRINYGCTNGDLLIGDLHKKSAVWTVMAMTKKQFSGYIRTQKVASRNAKIKEVWY